MVICRAKVGWFCIIRGFINKYLYNLVKINGKKSPNVFLKSLFSSKAKDSRGKVTVICGAKVGWFYIGLGPVTFL